MQIGDCFNITDPKALKKALKKALDNERLRIVSRLRTKVKSFIRKDTTLTSLQKQSVIRLFDLVCKSYGLTGGELGKKFEPAIRHSTVSRHAFDLNGSLLRFSRRHGIYPPLQIFAYVYVDHKDEYMHIGHFLICAESVEGTQKSKCARDMKPIDSILDPPQETWQDLYREFMFDSEYSPSPRWIELSGLRVETKEGDDHSGEINRRSTLSLTSQPRSVREMVANNKNVLVTGDAGSGKTTALMLLQSSLLSEEEECLPLYICLKDMERYLIEFLEQTRSINTAEMVGRGIAIHLLPQINRKPESRKRMQSLLQHFGHFTSRRSTYIDRLEELANIISSWLEEEGLSSKDTLLILDGINELIPSVRTALETPLSELLESNAKVVLSCRSNVSHSLLAHFPDSLSTFALQPLSEDDIVAYLNHHIPGQGSDLYYSEIHSDPQLNSMASTPFFLHLLSMQLVHQPEQKLPPNKARLVDDFVYESIERKRKEPTFLNKGSFTDVMIRVLAQVAHWCIRNVASDNAVTPDSFWSSEYLQNTQHSDTEVCDALELAEAYGFLRVSGLYGDSRYRFERPQFLHDNFRDFFAAKYLVTKLREKSGAHYLEEMMGNMECDNALRMYFELVDNSVKSCDLLLRDIAQDAPFLAAECVGARDDWKHETIREVFASLKRWECDSSKTDVRDYSTGGLSAARKLLTKVPVDALLEMFQVEENYSLELIAVPRVLLPLLSPDRVNDITKMLASYSRAYADFFFDGLASVDNLRGFRSLIYTLDNAVEEGYMDLSSIKDLFWLMQIVRSSAYTPSFYDSVAITRAIDTPYLRHLLLFRAQCSDEELKALSVHRDPVTQLIVNFKRCSKSGDYTDIVSTIEHLPIDILKEHPLSLFIVSSVSTLWPRAMEHIALEWSRQSVADQNDTDLARIAFNLVSTCSTTTTCQALSDALCNPSAPFVQTIVSTLRPLSCRPAMAQVIENLRLIDDRSQHTRMLALRYALGETLSTEDLSTLKKGICECLLQKSKESVTCNSETELILTCITKRLPYKEEDFGEVEEIVFEEASPELLSKLTLWKKLCLVARRVNDTSVQNYDYVLELIIEDTSIRDQTDIASISGVLCTYLPQGEDERFLTALWNRVEELIETKHFSIVHELINIAHDVDDRANRRWLLPRKREIYDRLPCTSPLFSSSN